MIATRILRRPRVLIVGCGDVGLRALPLLRSRAAAPRVIALTHHPERAAELRAAGALPIAGDLDARRSLRRLAGIARHVLHLAPPQREGETDRRTRALLAALRAPRRSPARSPQAAVAAHRAWRASSFIVPDASFGATSRATSPGAPYRFVYASTTGVYGDCGGALIDETRPVRPENERARRRVSAEEQLRRAGACSGWRVCIVRIPGIYADNRLPLARIERAMPALIERDDVYTNHIHADDLAAILVRALGRGRAQRVINASDDTDLRMADYFDRVADAYGLPRVPRITREQAEERLEPVTLSFMRESRRLSNSRLKRELRYALRYPTVDAFLRSRDGTKQR
ncbi:NAD-dependent epimerase/dehydratase family protein [Caballeronia sp. LZ062]|uniref:NAD-dependent epimerase/dehydratase family protein n=1 Tax=unclassified Caballeronia TaxID=2646786 RepID=UPI002856AB66|nr:MULTISPECIES: NAD-dependent epimerase/dehydratase family protein [unclassified Caballeronia]MDR5853817.1 NAD-dependent epimerase/dehydratase family protein [Caballeronia sp. LZ050]MDR5871651.1 NAD-dependent epimerase/dehydratase family protein [Caballeronia sp. LZ062]